MNEDSHALAGAALEFKLAASLRISGFWLSTPPLRRGLCAIAVTDRAEPVSALESGGLDLDSWDGYQCRYPMRPAAGGCDCWSRISEVSRNSSGRRSLLECTRRHLKKERKQRASSAGNQAIEAPAWSRSTVHQTLRRLSARHPMFSARWESAAVIMFRWKSIEWWRCYVFVVETLSVAARSAEIWHTATIIAEYPSI